MFAIDAWFFNYSISRSDLYSCSNASTNQKCGCMCECKCGQNAITGSTTTTSCWHTSCFPNNRKLIQSSICWGNFRLSHHHQLQNTSLCGRCNNLKSPSSRSKHTTKFHGKPSFMSCWSGSDNTTIQEHAASRSNSCSNSGSDDEQQVERTDSSHAR